LGTGVSIANWPTGNTNPPMGSAKPPAGSSTGAVSKAPFPVIATTSGPFPPKPIHIPAPNIPSLAVTGPEKPEQRRAFKLGVTLSLIGAGVLVCVTAFFGWKHFANGKSSKPEPVHSPKPEAVVQSAPPPKPTETQTVDALLAETAPSKTEAVETAPVTNNEPAKAEETPVKIDLDSPPPVAPSPSKETRSSSSPVATTVAPGVTANVGMSIANSGDSPAFRAFVANVKISGVFQGENSRAFINGRMIRTGETVDPALGIIFDHLDAEKKQIIFKDASGAVATRKY